MVYADYEYEEQEEEEETDGEEAAGLMGFSEGEGDEEDDEGRHGMAPLLEGIMEEDEADEPSGRDGGSRRGSAGSRRQSARENAEEMVMNDAPWWDEVLA